MNFYRKIEKSKFYVVLGIILDNFRHPKSIFRYRKLKVFMNFNNLFDQKIDFLIEKPISRSKKNGKKHGKT